MQNEHTLSFEEVIAVTKVVFPGHIIDGYKVQNFLSGKCGTRFLCLGPREQYREQVQLRILWDTKNREAHLALTEPVNFGDTVAQGSIPLLWKWRLFLLQKRIANEVPGARVYVVPADIIHRQHFFREDIQKMAHAPPRSFWPHVVRDFRDYPQLLKSAKSSIRWSFNRKRKRYGDLDIFHNSIRQWLRAIRAFEEYWKDGNWKNKRIRADFNRVLTEQVASLVKSLRASTYDEKKNATDLWEITRDFWDEHAPGAREAMQVMDDCRQRINDDQLRVSISSG